MMSKQGWQAHCRFGAGCALMALATLAQAQYVWVDAKGIKQFSDRAPPSSVPQQRILKAPSPAQPGAAADDNAELEKSTASATVKAPLTMAERNADFLKRKAQTAELDQKETQEAQHRADLASNCNGARENLRVLESGRRIGTIGKDGERVTLTDEERNQKIKRSQQALENCK